MVLINCILITICVVFIVDLSGIMIELETSLQKILKTDKKLKLKPISCSLCMTHHTCVIYLLCVNQFSIMTYTFVCMLAFISPIIKDTLILFKDLIIKIIDFIYFIINK